MAYIGAGINQTKTSVENSKDEFFGTYYGRAATDPTADPLGNAIDDGDLFYNTTEDALKIRVGGEWLNLRTSGNGYQQFTATADQTTFNVSGTYTPGFVIVTLNGVVLASGDYDDSSGTEIVLTNGAAADDIVGIYIFDTFSVSDTVSASGGGTFSGAVTFSDSVDVSDATFTVANDQISGDAIDGGTATPTTMNSTNLDVDSGTLFVDSANNRVGVGTSSPTADFTVNGFQSFPEKTDSSIAVDNSTTDGNGGNLTIKSGNGFGVGNVSGSLIFAFGRGGNSADNGDIRFGRANPNVSTGIEAEHARFDSLGRLLLDHTDTSEVGASDCKLSVENRKGVAGGISIGNNFQTGAANCIVFRNANGQVGRIKTDGGSTVYETSSDYRLKENLQEITDGVQRLKQIPTYKFNFISNPDKTVDGFLAHEVQPYVPEAISGEKDEVEAIGDITDSDGEIIKEGVTEPTELKEGQTWTKTGEQPVYQGIDQAKLVPLLTAALQEAVEKIEQLESRIETLETQ